MSFTTRIKFLNNNKKKKDYEMTQMKASLLPVNPLNDENPSDDAEKYVDIDGIKFKITESEGEDDNEDDDDEGGEPNEDANSTTSSSHELHKIKKRKTNQSAKKKTKTSKKEQKQQENLEKSKKEISLKINKRKVSLSKFQPNAPLYPVCRAWMVNEQESKYIDLDYLFIQYVKRPENGLKLLKALIDDEISCVSLMPAPVSKKTDEDNGAQKSRIPTTAVLGSRQQCERQQQQQQSTKSVLDNIIKRLENNETDDCPSTVGLLREHLQRWKNVKVNWKKHTRAYDEERYGVNFAILDAMFKLQLPKSN